MSGTDEMEILDRVSIWKKFIESPAMEDYLEILEAQAGSWEAQLLMRGEDQLGLDTAFRDAYNRGVRAGLRIAKNLPKTLFETLEEEADESGSESSERE